MARIRGFPPIGRSDAKLLILGSMPSLESLARGRYYAHPQNAFWPILTELLDLPGEDYATRADALAKRGIAVWDVLKTCFRNGSLDSAIDNRSIVVNDFPAFFRSHPEIRRVFFNGAKAESVYLKRVLPALDQSASRIERRRLPSTSPAHAGMSRKEKTEAWRAILQGLE